MSRRKLRDDEHAEGRAVKGSRGRCKEAGALMSATTEYPALLMIIRHGEKPGAPAGHDLSVMGSARAAALPSLFTPSADDTSTCELTELTCHLTVGVKTQFAGAYGSTQTKAVPPRFQATEFLFATSAEKDKKKHPQDSSDEHSNRPFETITPLAQALQLTINDSFANDSHGIKQIKEEILGKPEVYGGHIVLIAWHHGTIPALTEAFGVSSDQLPRSWKHGKWPPTVFDLIFCITWSSSGQATLDVEYQQLLYNDSAAVVGVV